MKRLLTRLVGGESLRHRPVALRSADQRPVRAIATLPGGEADIGRSLYPVSLNSLLLGLAREPEDPLPGAFDIHMEDASGEVVGSLRLEPAGSIAFPGGSIDLLRPVASSARCVPALYRTWRYFLAWRQVRHNAGRPNAFEMRLADLRALNIFYMIPRPVYLVSVMHDDACNMFPMDLVGPLGDDRFIMALRLTSPSVETMRTSGRIVVCGVPAAMKPDAYRLGAHHKERSIDWNSLGFPITPSPCFGLPISHAALTIRELEVLHSEAIGSHMLFATRIVAHESRSDAPQLCHVSDMYAIWRAEHGRPFSDA